MNLAIEYIHTSPENLICRFSDFPFQMTTEIYWKGFKVSSWTIHDQTEYVTGVGKVWLCLLGGW